MPFSSKLKADYVEMINGELDRIPVEGPAQFSIVAQELQNIFSSSLSLSFQGLFCSKPKSILSKATQDQLDYVRFCYKNPKEFVKSPENYTEYQKILKDRISVKIADFQKFTQKEQEAYTQFQIEQHIIKTVPSIT